MPKGHRVLLLAFLALLAAVVGLAAMANGNYHDSATLLWATGICLVAGLALLALRGRPTSDAERLVHALAGLVAAVALCLPAVWTFIYQVSTPADDTSGCGSISTPVQFFDPVVGSASPTPTCELRLRDQKIYVAGLAAPPLLIAGLSMLTGLKRSDARRPAERP